MLKKALKDLQNAIDYYDEQKIGLGLRFNKVIEKHFIAIIKKPHFQIRYQNVRCLPVKKFPYMIHFTVDEKTTTIHIEAILHTSRNSIQGL